MKKSVHLINLTVVYILSQLKKILHPVHEFFFSLLGLFYCHIRPYLPEHTWAKHAVVRLPENSNPTSGT